MKRFLVLFGITVCLFIGFANTTYAKVDGNSFITIVNPVRLSAYTKEPEISIKAEYSEVQKRNLPATWLLTYDIIVNPELASLFADMNNNQELGVFLEVTQKFSESSNVKYNETNSWHRATSLFLSGYSQEDRKKLIDSIFSKFKDVFGYYPKSVGAWWVDSYSLSYMKEKYGITGVLGISDQYDLDGYQVWGTPWSIPFYPSKIHAGIPAGDVSDKLDIVTFRWAARDPLNGYISPSDKNPSFYSAQDYLQTGVFHKYFERLVKLYSLQREFNKFGHITIGLEADYPPDTYEAIFGKRLDHIKELESQGINITTMEEFSEWYRKNFTLSPSHIIETDDLLGSAQKIIWFQNNRYRVGYVYNKESQASEVIDFRVYSYNVEEPFYKSPNKQYNLSINLPFIIDSVIDKNNTWKFNVGKLRSVKQKSGNLELVFEKGKIIFLENLIITSAIKVSKIILESKQLDVNENNGAVKLLTRKNFYVDTAGLEFKDYSLNIPFTIEYKIEKYKISIATAIAILGMGVSYVVRTKKVDKKYLLVIVLFGIVVVGLYLLIQANKKYYISQTEADALSVLSRFPQGKVLVYDKDCLKCSFVTPLKPAAAAGRKGYIGKYSNQPTVADFTFVTAPNSRAANKVLKDLNVRYVYLAKYEGYIEYLPYPPEDIGLKRVYENANVEIWGRTE